MRLYYARSKSLMEQIPLQSLNNVNDDIVDSNGVNINTTTVYSEK